MGEAARQQPEDLVPLVDRVAAGRSELLVIGE
jgi:hypothetical protein